MTVDQVTMNECPTPPHVTFLGFHLLKTEQTTLNFGSYISPADKRCCQGSLFEGGGEQWGVSDGFCLNVSFNVYILEAISRAYLNTNPSAIVNRPCSVEFVLIFQIASNRHMELTTSALP